MLSDICSSNKVCKLINKICVDRLFKTPKSELKWAVLFNDIDLNWNEIYGVAISSSRSTKLRYFQYQILHRYIGTNENLYKFGYTDTNRCTFCNTEIENIPHLFWYCSFVTRFWKDVQENILDNKVTLNMKDVILGIFHIETCRYNFVILHAKKYIYNSKCNKSALNIIAFKNVLKSVSVTEKLIANKNGKIDDWNKKWNSIAI